jgi:hypothetical protein
VVAGVGLLATAAGLLLAHRGAVNAPQLGKGPLTRTSDSPSRCGDTTLYVSLADRQSDIWMADIPRERARKPPW